MQRPALAIGIEALVPRAGMRARRLVQSHSLGVKGSLLIDLRECVC